MTSGRLSRAPHLATLRRQFLGLVVGWGLVVLLGMLLSWHWRGLASAARWALLTGGVSVLQLYLLWRHLPDNRRPGNIVVFPSLGVANGLTLVRGLLLALLAGFLFAPWPSGLLAWAPALIYTAAGIADGLDGYLARITDQPTLLGQVLDIEFDSLGALIVSALAVWYGQVPAWFLLVGLARYLFLLGIWWRRRRDLPVRSQPQSVHGRIVATLLMGFLSVILWPILYPPGTAFAAALFALPLAVSFGKDWLIVSGRVDPASPGYRRVVGQLLRVTTYWLPVLLRAVIVGAALLLLASALVTGGQGVAAFAVPGLPWPQLSGMLVLILALPGLPMVALGWLGRVGAILLIVAASASVLNTGLGALNGLLLAALITLLFTGTGAFSLWQPEERLLSRRVGTPRRSRS